MTERLEIAMQIKFGTSKVNKHVILTCEANFIRLPTNDLIWKRLDFLKEQVSYDHLTSRFIRMSLC